MQADDCAEHDTSQYEFKHVLSEQVVYRMKRGTTKKEQSLPLQTEGDDDPDDNVIAKWSDGMTFEVQNYTNKMLEWYLQQQSRSKGNAYGACTIKSIGSDDSKDGAGWRLVTCSEKRKLADKTEAVSNMLRIFRTCKGKSSAKLQVT
ncbi:unnamed protein product, partial [Prorocentrum cordatum]